MPMILRKNKAASNITVFIEKFPRIQYFKIMECFPFGMLQGLNFGQKLCFFYNETNWKLGKVL